MHKAGTSISDIARAFGRSYNCVRKYLARKGPYKHGSGSSPKLKDRAKRPIIRTISINDSLSLRNIASTLEPGPKINRSQFIRDEGMLKQRRRPY